MIQWATGYFQLAKGTTAQRPTIPTDGMMRLNSSKGIYEFYLNGEWVTFIPVSVDDAPAAARTSLSTAQLTSASGTASEPMLFIGDTTRNNKVLSASGQTYTWTANYLNNDDWVLLPNVYTSETGFVMPYDGTIIGITSYTTYSNNHSKSFSVWVDNVENREAHYVNGLNTSGATKTTSTNNIDFSRGSNVRLQARTPANYTGYYMGGIQYVSIAVQVKWRYVS